MDSAREQINDAEVLLRRVPPTSDSFQTVCDRGDGPSRAVSAAMSTRSDEEHLSCSRRRLTSPRQLLDDLRHDGIDPVGWHVCAFLVSDVRALGLEVVFTPTDRDRGHCSITDKNGLAFPNKKSQKLARRTRILAEGEIDQAPPRP